MTSVQSVRTKQEFITYLFEKGIVVEKGILDQLRESDYLSVLRFIDQHQLSHFGQEEYERMMQTHTHYFTKQGIPLSVEVIREYKEKNAKKTVRDFVSYYHHRYRVLKKILQAREGLGTIASINKMFSVKDVEDISIIGMIKEIAETKNGHKMVYIEDITGQTKVLINKNRKEIVEEAKELVEDEVVAIRGRLGDNILFANKIFYPEIPRNKEYKKGPHEVYAAFIGDLHAGSINFLEDNFKQFIQWLNGNVGSEQQRYVAERMGYLFIVGDLIAGAGNFPSQEKELVIKDVAKQFDYLASFLKQIPSHIKIIISPGNHDPVRLAEPQPVFPKKYAQSLYDMSNVTLTTNPSVVKIHQTDSFPGFDFLLYHGFSYFYYGDKVQYLVEKGGNDNTVEIMKYLLRKRHLAPSHNSNLYVPDKEEDFLLIQDVSDFFVSGHVHKLYADQYRHVTLLAASCWQSKTSYEEKLGREPEIGRVPVVNLKTREIKIFNFDHDGH